MFENYIHYVFVYAIHVGFKMKLSKYSIKTMTKILPIRSCHQTQRFIKCRSTLLSS